MEKTDIKEQFCEGGLAAIFTFVDHLRFMAMQTDEVQEHQYYMGLDSGCKVTFKEAYADWVETDHAERFRGTCAVRSNSIRVFCDVRCGIGLCKSKRDPTAKNFKACSAPMVYIHKVLDDAPGGKYSADRTLHLTEEEIAHLEDET